MKKKKLDLVNETLYFEKLDNGLEVYMLPKKDYHTAYAGYATYFGGDDTELLVDGEIINQPGIAHFIEHAIFDTKLANNASLFDFFKNQGIDYGATTYADWTWYRFSTNKSFKKRLTTMLSYIDNPDFTDSSIEKEKGVIQEEIKRTQSNAYDEKVRVFYECLFKGSKRGQCILGKTHEISRITKETLYEYYYTNYHPSNMCLILVGKFNPTELLKHIKDYQSTRDLTKYKLSTPLAEVIKREIGIKEKTIHLNIGTDEIILGFKLIKDDLSLKDHDLKIHLELLLRMMFSSSNKFVENLKERKLLVGAVGYFLNIQGPYIILIISACTKDTNTLKKELLKYIKNFKPCKDNFELLKKAKLANSIKSFDSLDNLFFATRDMLARYKTIPVDSVKMVKDAEFSKLENLYKELDFTNYTTLICKPKE